MSVFDHFAQPAWRHLVFALLHTLWQGAVLALLLVLTLRWISVRHPQVRYMLALVAQFAVLVAGLATWAVLEYQPPRPLPVPGATAPAVDTGVASPPPRPTLSQGTPEAAESGPVPWVSVTALGWLAGVVVMLIRTTSSALAAVRLTRAPQVQDRDLLDLVEQLRHKIGIRNHVRVVFSGRDLGPCVLGLVWPTIVLPLALATGMPAEEMRAILAHELAHIRRHDTLWNLGQMLVESFLFFNPVVWWLGRQVRVEREACCDATAVALTGRPLDYSRTLADWAEHRPGSTPHAAVVGWRGPRYPSLLRERILRILRPGERPRARISWGGLVVLLLVGPAVLFGLHRGTRVAVKLAAQVLAPAERLERLKVAQAEYAPQDVETPEEGEGQGKVTIKGTIRTPDGSALLKPITASLMTRSRNYSSTSAVMPLKETFSFESNYAGSTYLYVEPEDHAPTFVGPFVTRRGQAVEGIDILLEAGFPARVRVVDERGGPVVGVRVQGGLIIEGGSSTSATGWVTDNDGVAMIPHASRRSYNLSINGPGFQPFSASSVTLKPDLDTRLILTHAQPTQGVVVTTRGEPIAGARIKIFYEAGPSGNWHRAGIDPPIATTDSTGQFTLDRLEDEKTYAFLVESEAHGRGIVTGVEAGQSGLRWSVGPDHTIAGTIQGDLAVLDKDGGKPVVRVNQSVAIPDRQRGSHSERLFWSVPVEPVQGGGTFLIKGLLPGEATLTAGKQNLRLTVERPEHAVAIDLTQPGDVPASTRRVMLRILTPDGAVEPSGTVKVVAASRGGGLPVISRPLSIEEGKVAFDAPVPGSVHYESQGVVGYWFPNGNFEVEPSAEPKEVEVRGVPAGAIVGQVFDPDGHPVSQRVSVGYRTAETPPALKGLSFGGIQDIDAVQGRFFLSPLPIGGKYVVVVSQGHNKQVSRPITLDGTRATERVEIRLAKSAAASGRVIGPDGRPLRGIPVTLTLRHPQAGTTWGPPLLTDREGRFRFDDLSTELGPYLAVLDFRKDYQPAETNLNPGGTPVEIQLEPGHVVEGRILDAATGWPIPGVELYAHRPVWREGERYAYEAERLTDEHGRFRFSNLPAQAISLNDRNGLNWQPPGGSRLAEPDRGGMLEIRATLPTWSPLKPVKPGGN